MKTFKEFVQKEKEKYPVLSWDSSFRERKQPIPVLSWDSSFREHEFKNTVKDQLMEGFAFNDKLSIYYDDRHDKKYLKHGILTRKQESAIHSYTSVPTDYTSDPDDMKQGRMSSKNMNYYLRNRNAGNDLSDSAKKLGFLEQKDNDTGEATVTESDIIDGIESLASCFVPKHLNKSIVISYCGIPKDIAKTILGYSVGQFFHVAAFTSTSLRLGVAYDFVSTYTTSRNDNRYILRLQCLPGSALSVAKYSEMDESELLIRFGTKLKYLGEASKFSDNEQRFMAERSKLILLDCEVFPIKEKISRTEYVHHARELKDYGPYHHPEIEIVKG